MKCKCVACSVMSYAATGSSFNCCSGRQSEPQTSEETGLSRQPFDFAFILQSSGFITEYFLSVAKLREACFDPGSVMNGSRLGSDYKLGSTVTFHCEPGYQLQGYSTLTCVMGQNNRPEWNRALPDCQGDHPRTLQHAKLKHLIFH